MLFKVFNSESEALFQVQDWIRKGYKVTCYYDMDNGTKVIKVEAYKP